MCEIMHPMIMQLCPGSDFAMVMQ